MSLSKQVQRAQVSAKQPQASAQAPIDPMAMMQQMMAMMQAAAQQQSAPKQSTTVTGDVARQSIQEKTGKKTGKKRTLETKTKLTIPAEVGYVEFANSKGELVKKHVVGFPRGYDRDGNPQFGSGAIYGDSLDIVKEKVLAMATALGLISE